MAESTVSSTEYIPRHRFPLLDTDPHFKRVIRYMRFSDLATWLGFTAGTPALLYAWDLSNKIPVQHVKTQPRFYALGTWLGFCGGFLFACQRSTNRFLGWVENEREQKIQEEEFTRIARSGKTIWGESNLQPWIQSVAHHNSQFAHLKYSTIPWFNFVNHPYHGVDVSKYYEEAKVWRRENGLDDKLEEKNIS
ncbi:NADH-ubiquinone oxidoreductase complex I, 21 kDa subunit-domain-containing protein [Phakopsora pachyrhizi]|uniref:NADH-ubiquinone oxidoreductase complex I, 21 kDa subunit-domain-containing protein n=1 Tax=Phakopsora pachyrhizi TaxID=170000 RepID=A0AAV0BJI4_PHAPC|nr:NADH-ubiquinone oxidoreductase complex I, 21 kDa subunit-domain-containing protein [Phakopsora pachyrhizi]CAH7687466.1 NADH-ubiquinone oxidoreductase complex I, 21 kDa subunit-domain-containing protein [Phakopsora pachyrhizi]